MSGSPGGELTERQRRILYYGFRAICAFMSANAAAAFATGWLDASRWAHFMAAGYAVFFGLCSLMPVYKGRRYSEQAP